VTCAGAAKIGGGGGAAERERLHVIELHLEGRSADAARVERILAAVPVALASRSTVAGMVRVLEGVQAGVGAAGFSGAPAAKGVLPRAARGRLTSAWRRACRSRSRSSAASSTCSVVAPGWAWESPSRAAASLRRKRAETVTLRRRSSSVSGWTTSRRARAG
jgi:hypothetical protein